jgi:hypothetical protein
VKPVTAVDSSTDSEQDSRNTVAYRPSSKGEGDLMTTFLKAGGAVAAVIAALVVAVGVANAKNSGTLTVGPAFVDASGYGVVQATFTDTGNSTLTHVVVSFDLGAGTIDSGSSSAGCSGTTCSLGKIAKGDVVNLTVVFTGFTGSSITGTATWDAGTTSKGKGGSKDSSSDTVTPTMVNALTFGCTSTSSGGQGISVDGGGCNSIEGIDNGGHYFVKGIDNGQTATVTLTFGDGNLPFSGEDNTLEVAPQYLDEYPNYPGSLSPELAVDACDGYDGPLAVQTDPGHIVSTDSCISDITISDTVDEDNDAGTITLDVTGTPGDPGYIGK